jgi:hypothetical protein
VRPVAAGQHPWHGGRGGIVTGWKTTVAALGSDPRPHHLVKVGGLVATVVALFLLTVVGWYETRTAIAYLGLLLLGLAAMRWGDHREHAERLARRSPLEDER